MAKLERTIAIVTGASSGIGYATAERLAVAGYKVFGTSRRGAQSSPAIVRDAAPRRDQRCLGGSRRHGSDV